MSAYWRDAVRRVAGGDVVSKGEVVELGSASLENRMLNCRTARRRLEHAVEEVVSAVVAFEDAQAMFAAAVHAADIGATCTPHPVCVTSFTAIIGRKARRAEEEAQVA